ncbi:MAG: glycoside hydrolase family 66 protein [Clostridium beijerinckii]|nr:glycoside hydrolase family 66 protein [Clostridium beijerinckii]MCI1622140.1 glycoside hydrolase family 66 protein [Clostridium beijerinckii]
MKKYKKEMIQLIIKDLYPSKAQFNKGEKIEIIVDGEGSVSENYIRCNIYKLHENILSMEKSISTFENKVLFEFDINDDESFMSGYGVEVELFENGERMQVLTTAFDILSSWKNAPRYGFLSDFSPDDLGDKDDLKEMNKYHLNVVQYYDWMYRHHDLIPKEDIFIDPLNRKLSIQTIEGKIKLAHKYNMKAMGYGAVYAAAPDFYEKNKDLAIYKNNKEVYGFDNFLYMMDISKESKWHNHIIQEFYKAVKFGFDGIHMDQYGYPKEAIVNINEEEKIRNLREDFPVLINETRKYIEDKGEEVGLIFNAVNNWPIETVAEAEEDAVYIEVWPPNDTYQDLYNLISNAKKYASKKQVILAAYMKPFLQELNIPVEQAENATLLTMATIFASGGFHLLLGENNGVLNDPYYPKYRTMESESFKKKLREYYDFIVKYEELIYDFDIIDTSMVNTGGINEEYVINGVNASPKAEADCIWSLIKEKPGYKIINLVNFAGIGDMNWNVAKEKRPSEIKNIEVSMLTCNEVKGVYVASPDYNEGKALKLDFEYIQSENGNKVKFIIPELKVWDLVYIIY